MIRVLILLSSLVLAACASAPRSPSSGAFHWPDFTNTTDSLNRMQLTACQDFARTLRGEDGVLKTDQLVVVKDGALVYEWNAPGFRSDSPHCLWSASKTVTATITAAAIEKRMLSLEDRVAQYFPEARRPATVRGAAAESSYNQITVRHLLEMGSGLQWQESYEDANQVAKSDVLKMVYGSGQRDMLAYSLDAPMVPGGPGSQWLYSGGNSSILLGILRQLSGARYDSLPWDLLFNPLGMSGAVFEQDGSGNFVGSSYVFSNPRDMARIGLLYMNDGMWQGRRILPEHWVSEARQISPAQRAPATPTAYILDEGVFGRTVWLNQPIPEKNVPKPFPHAPDDVFFAAGHYGQWILLFPSQNLILARTGHDGEYWSKLDDVFAKTVACFGGDR